MCCYCYSHFFDVTEAVNRVDLHLEHDYYNKLPKNYIEINFKKALPCHQ